MLTLEKAADGAKVSDECIPIYKWTKTNLISRTGRLSTVKSLSVSDSSDVKFESAWYNGKV